MTFKEKLKSGQRLIGTHINLTDPTSARIAALAGYDYIWVDMEHSYLSFADLNNIIFAIRATDTAVIVRTAQDDLTFTKKIMEMGPDGIIFPMVRSKEEADRLISWTLYPPYGKRGFGPMGAVDFGFKNVRDYVYNNHNDFCRFIQIEHKEAVSDLENIMDNEFIDGYIFGPNDLSGSINEIMDVFGDNTIALIKESIEKLKSRGKVIGLSTGDCDEEIFKKWSDMGIQMISADADFGMLVNAHKQNVEKLKSAHKK